MRQTLATYPTISWRRPGHREDGKIHYTGKSSNVTLCGRKVPVKREESDAIDMCERCLKIAETRKR